MTDSETILNELKDHGRRLGKIEEAIQNIAIQNNKIGTLQQQTNDLYNKYDEISKPDGIVSEIQKFQASCPREQIKTQINQMRWAIGIVATGELSLVVALFVMIARMG